METTRYVIEHGDPWMETLSAEGRRIELRHVADSSQRLAIAYEEEGGNMLRHGLHDLVSAWASSDKGRAGKALFGPIVVAAFPVSDEGARILNECLENGARAGSLLGDRSLGAPPPPSRA